MPKEIKLVVHTLKEMMDDKISESAIQKAKDQIIEMAGFDPDFVLSDWEEALNAIGFEDVKIYYSGFWSQGDGASFTGKPNITKLLDFFVKGYKPSPQPENMIEYALHKMQWSSLGTNHSYNWLSLIADHLSATLQRYNDRYSHENTVKFFIETTTGRWEIDKAINDFEHDVDKLRYSLCKAIYKDLQDHYEYFTSDESLIELSEENQWLFDRNGRIWSPASF